MGKNEAKLYRKIMTGYAVIGSVHRRNGRARCNRDTS